MNFWLVYIEISNVQLYLTKSYCSLITDNADLTHFLDCRPSISVTIKLCADLELIVEHCNVHSVTDDSTLSFYLFLACPKSSSKFLPLFQIA
jgi:hypothetical protein